MSSSQPEALFSFPGCQEKLDVLIKAPEVSFMQNGSKVEVEELQSSLGLGGKAPTGPEEGPQE